MFKVVGILKPCYLKVNFKRSLINRDATENSSDGTAIYVSPNITHSFLINVREMHILPLFDAVLFQFQQRQTAVTF